MQAARPPPWLGIEKRNQGQPSLPRLPLGVTAPPRPKALCFGNAYFEGRICGSWSVSFSSMPNLGWGLAEDQVRRDSWEQHRAELLSYENPKSSINRSPTTALPLPHCPGLAVAASQFHPSSLSRSTIRMRSWAPERGALAPSGPDARALPPPCPHCSCPPALSPPPPPTSSRGAFSLAVLRLFAISFCTWSLSGTHSLHPWG